MIVNEAVFPVVNFSFDRSVEEVSVVLMSPVGLLLIDFTSVTLLAPDLPVMEHEALRAFETVYDNFLFAAEGFDLNRKDNDDFGLATVPESFKTGNL